MWWYFRDPISLCLTNYILKHSLISNFRKLLESISCTNLSDCQWTLKCFRFLFLKFMSTLLVSIIMYLVLNLALESEDLCKSPLHHLIFFPFSSSNTVSNGTHLSLNYLSESLREKFWKKKKKELIVNEVLIEPLLRWHLQYNLMKANEIGKLIQYNFKEGWFALQNL